MEMRYMLSNGLYGLVLNGRFAFANRREFMRRMLTSRVEPRRKQFRLDFADGWVWRVINARG